MQRMIQNVILILIVLIFSLCFCSKVEANTGFNKYNGAPRIIFSANVKEFKDIKLTIRDHTEIDSVKFFEIDNSTDEKKEVQFDKLDSSTNTEWNFKISHENYLKETEKRLYVEATDKSGNYRTATAHISIKEKHYKVDVAPRVQGFTAKENKITFNANDTNGVKIIKIYDLNEQTEEAKNKEKLTITDTEEYNQVTFNIGKFIKNEQDKKYNYDLKIVSEDKGKNTQTTSLRIRFKLPDLENSSNENNEQENLDEVTVKHEEPKTKTKDENNNNKKNKDKDDKKDADKVEIELDKTVLMLDGDHYKFSDLKVTKLEPENAKVKYSTDNDKVAKVNSKTGRIDAVAYDGKGAGYGTATITATATYKGKTATAKCKVRVIVRFDKKTSDSKPYVNYREPNDGRGPQTYWIRNYDASLKNQEVKDWSKERIEKQHWSDEEVESYINNAAYLIKNYPEKFYESAVQSFYVRTASNTSYPTSNVRKYTKPKGEIVVTGGQYILLFTSKNQSVYLLKFVDGRWKLDEKVVASGGYNYGAKYSNYLVIPRWVNNSSGGRAYYAIEQKGAGATDTRPTNAIHYGQTYGRPASGGCIRIGNSSSTMWKKILNIVQHRDTEGPIKFIYY